jgi:hypothetical protein
MYIILGYTNELSKCLQRREQDILNAIALVNVAKKRMQELRSDGWDNFLFFLRQILWGSSPQLQKLK